MQDMDKQKTKLVNYTRHLSPTMKPLADIHSGQEDILGIFFDGQGLGNGKGDTCGSPLINKGAIVCCSGDGSGAGALFWCSCDPDVGIVKHSSEGCSCILDLDSRRNCVPGSGYGSGEGLCY